MKQIESLAAPAIRLGSPRSYNTSADHQVHGDIWATAWAPDGTLYMLADDFNGFQDELMPGGRNVSFCRLDGTPPDVVGTVVNSLDEMGVAGELGPDGANWKGSGIASIDGSLYMFASRQWYGLFTPGRKEIKLHLHLLRSDDGGHTWTWSADAEGRRAPLIPGPGFAAAYFVDLGQDGNLPERDGAGDFVYAVSSDGAWDNGDCMTLGRVRRDRIAALDGGDWEFYRGGDGALDSAWGPIAEATPIVSAIRRCSMTGMHFLPGLGKYLIVQWHYPDLRPEECATSDSVWELYLGDHPWGPFTLTGRHRWDGIGLYNPYVPSKFLNADGRSGTIVTTGNFQTSAAPWDETVYTMQLLEFSIDPE